MSKKVKRIEEGFEKELLLRIKGLRDDIATSSEWRRSNNFSTSDSASAMISQIKGRVQDIMSQKASQQQAID